MCRFLSAIVMSTGNVKCEPMIDSHIQLLEYFGIADDVDPSIRQRFAKIEFIPPSKQSDFLDLNKWELVVDEPTKPDWWFGVQDKVLSTMKNIVESMIIRDKRNIVIGGCWIIAKTGRIDHLIQGRIAAIESGADLIRANLGWTNLSGANLSGADLSGANLIRADLGWTNLSGADLSGADLSGANPSKANFSGTYFGNANNQ